ncbi:thioredoxin domain-containing protein [Allokutzneria sp. A3M-2-11 16]|uniref:DsbA family protein n=1 Tax=Allokutzneria sp. A3M-2-11 16 TaxID=2962043 RepID=UPI0020B8328A|nr:thioredoxin domain-containing protein [Allokutzneria sp. A3M-2-11 16]MCP3801121.1 thioredoxin domain-containing protein [Allokutzneria sp. A3M-2-11 16]
MSTQSDEQQDFTASKPDQRVPVSRWLVPALVVVALVALVYVSTGRGGENEDTPAAAPKSTMQSTAQQTTPADDGTTGRIDESVGRRKAGDPYAMGRVDAPVVLVEFADYRCPYCVKFATDTKPELIRRYVDNGTLRIEWRDYPMFGEESENAALAARAAGRQGKFWPYHELAFEEAPRKGRASFPRERLVEIAKRVGVADLKRFEADLADPALAEEIKADMMDGRRIGVSGTPAFVLNGRPMVGARPLEDFVAMIERLKNTGR